MRSMKRQFGKAGTISAFALGPRKTKKYLCRDGRSQDLPDTDSKWSLIDLQVKVSLQFLLISFYKQPNKKRGISGETLTNFVEMCAGETHNLVKIFRS
jgi:hypothetical protein